MSKIKLLLDVVQDMRSLADSLQAVAEAVAESGAAETELTTTKEPEKAGKTGKTAAKNTVKKDTEYCPPWEPPVSRFRATRKWYFLPSEPPQHIVAAHIFDFTINLLIVILGELLMQYHQIIYREVFLCLRRQKSEVFWNFWEKI